MREERVVVIEELDWNMWNEGETVDYLRRAAANGAVLDAGHEDVVYRGVKYLNGRQLEKGQLVLTTYDSYNTGYGLYEILGLTGWDEEYGGKAAIGEPYDADEHIEFDSVEDLMEAEGVDTLGELERKQDQRVREGGEDMWGHHSYLVVRDLQWDPDDEHFGGPNYKQGPWFYQSGGRWCRGSGAEPLSFVLLEEVKRDELPKPNEVREYRSKLNSALQALYPTTRMFLDVPYLPQDDELDRLVGKADALAQEYARALSEFRARANDIAAEARIRAQDIQKELEGDDA